jgi:hypothetical protein
MQAWNHTRNQHASKKTEGLDEFHYLMHKEFAGICATIEDIDQPLQWQTKVMGGPSKFPSSFSFA